MSVLEGSEKDFRTRKRDKDLRRIAAHSRPIGTPHAFLFANEQIGPDPRAR
jgi:hypothetical protein